MVPVVMQSSKKRMDRRRTFHQGRRKASDWERLSNRESIVFIMGFPKAHEHEAIAEITEYIEIFYNRRRIQARLVYLSPAAYEHQYYVLRIAA